MRKISNRTRKVILITSVIVLVALSISLVFLYQQKLKDVQAKDYGYSGSQVFTLEEMDKLHLAANTDDLGAYGWKYPFMLDGKATYTSNLFDGYSRSAFSQMYIYIAAYIIFAVVLVFIMWKLLKKTWLVETEKSVGEVLAIDTIETNADIKELIAKMKKEIETNAHDYRQLQAYLAHEQKNSLSAIKSTLELDGQSEYIPYLDDISNSIDDLLTLSESDDSISETRTDITLVCARAVDLYKKRFKDITFQFNEEDESFVLGEERWLYRAICNLLDNAIKYGNQKPVNVEIKKKHNSIILFVRDQGIGIKESDFLSIFENRYRINELNTDGYGIGLSLVKHVCNLCNGNVWLESKINEGSIFYLSFPFANEVEGEKI